jgi:Rrf2 family protein
MVCILWQPCAIVKHVSKRLSEDSSMQVALTRKGDYAVRAMLELARHYGSGRRKARQISAVMDVPERYLPQILALLVRRGLLVATAGPDGGYELARAPAEITLLEVVEAAEGPIAADRCLLRGGPCDWEHACPLHHPWRRAQEALAEQLRVTTFAELAGVDEALEAGLVPPPGQPLHGEQVTRRGVRERAGQDVAGL